MKPGAPRTALLAVLAMFAFAANSLLCRMALGAGLIDAASFTTIRVAAGALLLLALVLPRWRAQGRPRADWRTVVALFAYMVCFSFAYVSLSAGTGALLLFGAVQLTMLAVSLRGGAKFPPVAWAGLLLATGGVVYLVWPGVTAPDPRGAALMAMAGIAWGVYSLLGRGVADPLQATAGNFLFSVPLVLATSLLFAAQIHATWTGALLAIASGAIASGVGYVIWYAALRGLSATTAATIQLSVPAIAAMAGVLLLSERPTLRLLFASTAILGGIALVLLRPFARGARSA